MVPSLAPSTARSRHIPAHLDKALVLPCELAGLARRTVGLSSRRRLVGCIWHRSTSETYTYRPPNMQPEAPPSEEGSSTILETEGAPKGTKRRRPSPRNSKSDSEQSAESTREPVAPGTETLSTAAGPQIDGSSRQNDTTMRSSTPPEGGSIRYTRTGRVSKATKGQRVHQCEECGKLYTRAEHLRYALPYEYRVSH